MQETLTKGGRIKMRTFFLMIRLTPEEATKLKAMAKEEEIYVSEYVRKLIFQEFKHNQREKGGEIRWLAKENLTSLM